MTDWILPEYTFFSGREDQGVEIHFDDEAINRCRKNPDWQADCQTCPARARCDELIRAEWARHLQWEEWDRLNSLDSPEEVER